MAGSHGSYRLGRRSFLKAGCAASLLIPKVTFGRSPSGEDKEERVLVLLQLTGGNDGLNTVIPFDNDIYHHSRPTLALSRREVVPIADGLGFHPELKPLVPLFKEGFLAVVQGVGYPKPSGGHQEAMQDWQTARPHVRWCRTGWIGRVLSGVESRASERIAALYVGSLPVPLALRGRRVFVPGIGRPEELLLPKGKPTRLLLSCVTSDGRTYHALEKRYAKRLVTGLELSNRIERAVASKVQYPPFSLAERLRDVARLIRARIGLRVVMTDLGGPPPGGFDTHANQACNHGALLRQLACSVAAFVRDLQQDGTIKRVVLMTFSEFGRTVAENGRHGTGHGSAAPVFLAGGALRGGIIGKVPELRELENGGPKHHIDFRSLYATVLRDWFGLPEKPAVRGRFQTLPLFRT